VTPAQHRLVAAKMSEAELQEHVRQMCAGLGLAAQHIHDPRRCWLPGWPDVVIIGREIIYRELKSEYGRPTPEQTALGCKLKAAGASWKIWRPGDLLSGLIGAELAEVAAVQTELFSA